MLGRWVLTALLLTATGCRTIAIGAVADALSGTGGGFSRDDDPELVAAAAPFGLKTMESVLAETPEHAGLLLALTSGYTQYGFAFVEAPAEEEANLERSRAARERARRLYRRARGYGERGLELVRPGFAADVRKDPKAALADLEAEHVPLLYWTAAAWGLLIGRSLDDPAQIADFPIVAAIAERALALDEGYGAGALHELMISVELARPGGKVEKARQHFARAVALSRGGRLGPYVTLAEKVTVREQNAKEFRALLEQALAIPLASFPDDRLANEVARRRATRLLAKIEDLFLDPTGEESAPPEDEGTP